MEKIAFPKLKLSRHTIARDLTVGLIATIAVVFTFVGAVNYVYSVKRDTAALYEKADEIMENLASVLVTPMWNLNMDELEKIVHVYRQSGIVLDIKLIGESGESFIKSSKLEEKPFFELTHVIHYDDISIGRVTVAFSDSDIIGKQREIAIYSVIVFAFLIFSLILATTLLLRRFLAVPLNELKSGLDVISAGNYTHRFKAVKQEEVNSITLKVMAMAKEIARRESALEENRHKLEILNQAILDIFSCSDMSSLVRTTLALSHKICGVERGWFLGINDDIAFSEEDKASTSVPLVCVEGHTFEATRMEVEAHVGKPDDATHFTFQLKSRTQTIGQMTLAFAASPDSSTIFLLKSLMSLATLAIIRQSFIRETAFITAEMQVAETVQRSMLPDEGRLPANAIVSYHYEPVLRVGGDWFSVIEAHDGKSLYLILGDVTGHGLAQGLVATAMAGALNIIESMIQEFGSTGLARPSQIVTQLNNVISRITGKSNLRMTCVAAKIDFERRELMICNAGHTFPLLLRHQLNEAVKVKSLARKQQHMLGEDRSVIGKHTFQDASYEFEADDILLFYTDGLTEALDKDGRSFIRRFYRHFAKKTVARSVVEVRDDLIKLFRQHTSDVPVKDDICVLVVGKRPSP